MELFDKVYWGNTVRAHAIAAGVAVVLFVTILVARAVATRRLRRATEQTLNRYDDLAVELICQLRTVIALAISIYAGSLLLTLEPDVRRVLRAITVIAVAVQIGLWGTRAIGFAMSEYRARKVGTAAEGTVGAFSLLAAVAQLVLWSVVVMLVLDNLGFNVTALVAGLGIGGLALALAVQNVLADLFASISIVLDRPFGIGDTIQLGDVIGTVERIGIRTTWLRAPDGEQIICGNGDILKARIRNLKRIRERRAVIELKLDYRTPVDKLEAAPGLVERLVTEIGRDVRFDRAAITGLGPTAIDFQIVYFLTVPDSRRANDARQAVCLAILRAFEEQGIRLVRPA